MSKWLIITISAVLITVGIITGAIIFWIKKSKSDDDAADEIYLKTKAALLNNAVDSYLDSGALADESKKIAINSAATRNAVNRNNSLLAAEIAKKKASIDNLRKKYMQELNKIK